MRKSMKSAISMKQFAMECGQRVLAERQAEQDSGVHILDLQWGYKFEFNLDGEAVFWHRGYGYYVGVGHEDEDSQKLDHLARSPCDMVIDLDFSPYRSMKFEDFKKSIDELIARKAKTAKS